MQIYNAVRDENFCQAKYPCFGWNSQHGVEITVVCKTEQEAAAIAKSQLKRHHARKSLVCRWFTREEIIKNLEGQVQQLKGHDRKFNSPQAGSDAYNLQGIINELKRAITR